MSGGGRGAGWWARSGIRTRSTVAAVAASAMALTIGSIALLTILDLRLTASVEESVSIRLKDLASQVANQNPAGIEAFAGSSPGDSTIVQVVGADGRVMVASGSVQGEPAVVDPYQQVTEIVIDRQPLPFVDGIEYLVASKGVDRGGAVLTVVAAQSLAPIGASISALAVALLIGGPALLFGVGIVTWVAVGRSLGSVRRIRSRVEEIDAFGLEERVPVPLSNDEVSNLARTMNHMLDRVHTMVVQQRQFLADASHELKTPLATMRTTLDVASRTDQSLADVEPVLETSVHRMTRLVEDLLVIAHTEDNRMSDSFSEVDLDQVIEEAASGVHVDDSEMTLIVTSQPIRLEGNRLLLQRALRNVIENAVTYGSSLARVEASVESGRAVIVVSDNGPGIPESQRQRVFDRFVRLDEHRSRSAGGTGLGLAIAKEIISAHGGTITITGSASEGTAVTIELPIAHGSTVTASSR